MLKPYVGAIIQARLTSTRLPNKILLEINGKPILEHLVNRVQLAKKIDKVVIASPHSPECCLNEEIFIGSENDVLDRYYQCAKKYGFDIIVRLTSDCPFIPPYEIDRVVNRLISKPSSHHATNINGLNDRFGTPDGWDVEAFTYHALETAWKEAKEPIDREHVTPYMKACAQFKPVYLEPLKLSIDTLEDYERLKLFYSTECLNYQIPLTYTERA